MFPIPTRPGRLMVNMSSYFSGRNLNAQERNMLGSNTRYFTDLIFLAAISSHFDLTLYLDMFYMSISLRI